MHRAVSRRRRSRLQSVDSARLGHHPINEIVPASFQSGRPTQCEIRGVISNATKYHVEKIGYNIYGLDAELDDFFAGRKDDHGVIYTIQLGDNEHSCVGQASMIISHPLIATVKDCQMTGVVEGDCQSRVNISSNLNDQTPATVGAAENREADLEMAPLTKILSQMPNPPSDSQLLDAIVWVDSQAWASNQYQPGSMTNVTLDSQASDGSNRTLRGEYSYVGGSTGWVKVTVYRNHHLFPCVEFWDFAGSCRPMNIPNDKPVPPLPAPLPAPPPPPPVQEGAQTPPAPPSSPDPSSTGANSDQQ
ncbi:MAG TPA: hypothetical protein VHY34_06990 [Caulobacteraceae bacterium]|nr:hypothetical protein [Caulobacteraceae bacterium]